MTQVDIVFEKLFPYEGIPEIILTFFTPEFQHEFGSESFRKILENKYKSISDNPNATLFNGKYHSYNDQPSHVSDYYITIPVKLFTYHKYGKMHRDNGPAWINVLKQAWYKDDKLHRDNDLPAVIYFTSISKSEQWYKEGLPHRDNDLPAFISTDQITGQQTKQWWFNGTFIKAG